MILILEHDYDNSEPVGIFPSTKEFYKLCKEQGWRPQRYSGYIVSNMTNIEYIDLEIWCTWEKCTTRTNIPSKYGRFCTEHLEQGIAKAIAREEDVKRKIAEMEKKAKEDRVRRKENHDRLCEEMGIPKHSLIAQIPSQYTDTKSIFSGTSY